MTVVVSPGAGPMARIWRTTLEVAAIFTDLPWLLIGAQMVMLLEREAGRSSARTTGDVDVIIDLRVLAGGMRTVVDRLSAAEFGIVGFSGRFGAGTPRINDGSFLFLQHMIGKLKRPEDGDGRLAIVFNGSPLFTGGAGSGESEIRRWIIENDWLEGIVALPDQHFYDTGISTYFWIVTNRKRPERRGKVQLVDARSSWSMRASWPPRCASVSATSSSTSPTSRSPRSPVSTATSRMVSIVRILPNEAFGL